MRQNTRHVCVEGWDVIGRFGGTPPFEFLKLIGADPTARFISVQCADDYYDRSTWPRRCDPQTLLCYECTTSRSRASMARPSVSTCHQIGYKQANTSRI